MEAILGSLPQLAALIEKGGVVGLMLIFLGIAVYEVVRLRKENKSIYVQRDRAVVGLVKCKTLLEANKIAVDLSEIKDLIPNGST